MGDELIKLPSLPTSALQGVRQSAPPLLLRQLSQRLVFEAILHQGSISRADLAKATGLSKQTVSEVMNSFEQQGWAEPAGRSSGGIGRTALLYRLYNAASYAVGVDLGGTKIAAAVVDLTGNIIAEAVQPTTPEGGTVVLDQIVSLVNELLRSNAIPSERVNSIALGTPGVVSPRTGSIHYSPNISGLENLDVAAYLSGKFGVSILIDNDANLAVLGEKWCGAAQQVDDLAFIALGTGVGMGLMLGGRLVKGHNGLAGEISYLPFGTDLYSAAAKKYGALELEIGSAAILRRYAKIEAPADITARELFDRLGEDPQADTAIAETARWLALAIASVAAVVDPELFILGGSIGVRAELVQRVSAELERLSDRPIRITASVLGNRAGLLGAVAAALSGLHNQFFGLTNLPVDLSLPRLEGGAALPINAEEEQS